MVTLLQDFLRALLVDNLGLFLTLSFASFVVLVFRRRIIGGSIGSSGVDVIIESIKDEGTQTRDEVVKLFEEGKSYPDWNTAFEDLYQSINTTLKQTQTSGGEQKITLKLIAVAMTFSTNFVQARVKKILEDFPKATINIEIVLVDPDYLDDLPIERKELNWAERARLAQSAMKNFRESSLEQYRGNISIETKLYRNIPHWHGWLINDDYLFIGRTDWVLVEQKGKTVPKLTVGQNTYRYYDRTTMSGKDRISLFANWHNYYFDYGLLNGPPTGSDE